MENPENPENPRDSIEQGFFAKPYFQQAVAKFTGVLGLLLLILFPISIILAIIGLIASISVRYKNGIILNSIVFVLAIILPFICMMLLVIIMAIDNPSILF